ncbi:MAG: fasciclin domain-containing protein [Planctomycetes bacterium]|nr:fasciclin domain-containing protein [Planctomycetota bacterium]
MPNKLLALVALACLNGAPVRAADTANVYDTLLAMKAHTVVQVAVKETGTIALLKGDKPVTLFAPTDAAFRALGAATVQKLATDREALKALIRAHLVTGKYTTEELTPLDGKELRSLADAGLKVEVTKDGVRVGGAKLVVTNVQCSNGVIHVIDAVLK